MASSTLATLAILCVFCNCTSLLYYANYVLADIEAMRLDADAKTRAEDNKIMLADLTNMDEDQRALILKKRAEIRVRDV